MNIIGSIVAKKKDPVEDFSQRKAAQLEANKRLRDLKADYTTVLFSSCSVNENGQPTVINFVKIVRDNDSIDVDAHDFVDFTVKILRITAKGTKTLNVGRGRSRIDEDGVILQPMLLGNYPEDAREIIKKYGYKHMKHISKGRYRFDERIQKKNRAKITALVES